MGKRYRHNVGLLRIAKITYQSYIDTMYDHLRMSALKGLSLQKRLKVQWQDFHKIFQIISFSILFDEYARFVPSFKDEHPQNLKPTKGINSCSMSMIYL